MSLVDDIFSSIPAPLINQFGSSVTYVKASTNQAYDPTTGTVQGSSTCVSVKAVIYDLKPEEIEGQFQQGDLKFLISADALSGYYPRTTDSITYSQGGASRTAKVIAVMSNRGDNAIIHTVVARVS